jgi:hypothetical protein
LIRSIILARSFARRLAVSSSSGGAGFGGSGFGGGGWQDQTPAESQGGDPYGGGGDDPYS